MTDEEMRAKVKKMVADWVRQHDLWSYVEPSLTGGEVSDLEFRILALLKELEVAFYCPRCQWNEPESSPPPQSQPPRIDF